MFDKEKIHALIAQMQLDNEHVKIEARRLNQFLRQHPELFPEKSKGFKQWHRHHQTRSEFFSFNQSNMQLSHFKTLKSIQIRHGGLCEIIANFVMVNDLLANKQSNACLPTAHSSQIQLVNHEFILTTNALKQDITPDALNKTHIKKSHILHVSNFIETMLAYFFNVYPYSLYKWSEKTSQKNQVNEKLLLEKLNQLPDEAYVKFQVFKKGLFTFDGHSMLIKKTGDSYSFFDPNVGENKNINFHTLCQKINASMKTYQGTHMAFLDGEQFLNKAIPTERMPSTPICRH